MEGLAWLIMKMAVLLAITGASFLALGWWLRGRQDEPEAPHVEPIQSTPVSRPELVEKIEFLRSSLRTTEEERDAARRELAAVHEQMSALTTELDALKSKPSVPAEELVLVASAQESPAKSAKPKGTRKPRAKKAKG